MAVACLLSLALGVLSDLLRTNRVLLEDQLERIKEIQYRVVEAPPSGAPGMLPSSSAAPAPVRVPRVVAAEGSAARRPSGAADVRS